MFGSTFNSNYIIAMMDVYFESVEDTNLGMEETVYILFSMGCEI